jgi:hypothetical protein
MSHVHSSDSVDFGGRSLAGKGLLSSCLVIGSAGGVFFAVFGTLLSGMYNGPLCPHAASKLVATITAPKRNKTE